MDSYQILQDKITSYFERDEIKRTDEYLSIYDLYVILDQKFQKFREIQFNQKFISKIHHDRKWKRRNSLFDSKLDWKNLDDILVSTEKNTARVSFFFGTGFHPDVFTVLRNFGGSQISFSSTTIPDFEFVKRYQKDLEMIFDTLEEFSLLFHKNIHSSREDSFSLPLTFTDGFLTLSILLDSYGKVSSSIEINSNYDPDSLYHREWYTRKKLSDLVEERKDELLKKIAIPVQSLDDISKQIIYEKK